MSGFNPVRGGSVIAKPGLIETVMIDEVRTFLAATPQAMCSIDLPVNSYYTFVSEMNFQLVGLGFGGRDYSRWAVYRAEAAAAFTDNVNDLNVHGITLSAGNPVSGANYQRTITLGYTASFDVHVFGTIKIFGK